MIKLELTEDEAEALYKMVEWCLSDLRYEIAHTEKEPYCARLKQQQDVLKRLLYRLEAERSKVKL